MNECVVLWWSGELNESDVVVDELDAGFGVGMEMPMSRHSKRP